MKRQPRRRQRTVKQQLTSNDCHSTEPHRTKAASLIARCFANRDGQAVRAWLVLLLLCRVVFALFRFDRSSINALPPLQVERHSLSVSFCAAMADKMLDC